MRDIIQCMSVLCKAPNPQNDVSSSGDDKKPEVKDSSATQTEIVAVHTPQVENLPFPFASKLPRPSTLSLNDSNGSSTSSTIRKIPEKESEESNGNEKKSDTSVSTTTDNKDETLKSPATSDSKPIQND